MSTKALSWLSIFHISKDNLTLWMNNLIVVYAFFIPIDSSITSRIFIAVLVLLVMRGNIIVSLREAWNNAVIRAFAYMIGVYLVWMIGSDNFKEAMASFKHIKGALYIFVFFIIIDARYRDKIIGAFILGMIVSETLSYMIFFRIIPLEFLIAGEHIYKAYGVGDPTPFLHHLHYGILLAFTAILLARNVMYPYVSTRFKLIVALFVVITSANIFIIGGRTGYFSFFPLIAFFVFYYQRQWIVPVMVGSILFAGIMYEVSPVLQKKINQTVVEIEKLAQSDKNYISSVGQRTEFWIYSTKVIKENFWFGVGTGDSMNEVLAIIPPEDTFVRTIDHEHNQFISVMLQFGLIGLIFFLNIFYQIYKFKPDNKDMRFIQLAITLAIGIGITMTIFNLRVFLHLWILMLALTMVPSSRRTIDGPLQPMKRFLVETVTLGSLFYSVIFLKDATF